MDTEYSINEIWKKAVKFLRERDTILSVFVFFGLVGYYFYQNNVLGKGGYNKNIKLTADMIAYTRLPVEHWSFRESDIFLVDINTGEQFQLTKDRYEDGGLCWSPDGTRLLIATHRSQKKIARHSDSDNPSYLFIYDFRTGEEYSLEKAFQEEEEKAKNYLEEQGYILKPFDDFLPNSLSPHWFEMNRIGFIRDESRYLEMGGPRSTDTLGHNMTVYRKPDDGIRWLYMGPMWISNDSLLVTMDKYSIEHEENSNIALFLPKENRFEKLTNYNGNTNASIFDLSLDKRKLLYRESIVPENESEEWKTRYVILNLTTNEKRYLPKHIGGSIFSPSVKMVAFINKVNEEDEIFIADLNGKNIKRLTFDGGYKGNLAWRPTSKY